MYTGIEKREIAKMLQAKINTMQGLGKSALAMANSDFLPFSSAFPDQVFPTGTIHEFLSDEPADAAATTGFITALSGKFMKEGSICLWVGNGMTVFPAGLKHFGLEPDRIVFIQSTKPKDTLWIIEEALKCEALTAVIGEIRTLSFSDSRRLQLAVERSGVTGFIHRYQPYAENAVACTSRWRIRPLPSETQDGLPGVGESRWEVQLLKVKNGRPHSWQINWSNQQFFTITDHHAALTLPESYAV